MITILYGEKTPEPYCIDARKKAALKGVNIGGINYSSMTGKFDAEVVALARTYPLFEEKRGIVLEVSSLKDLDNKDFMEYVKAPAPFTEMVIVCQDADKRLKVYKQMTEGKIPVQHHLCDKKTITKDRLIKVIAYELGDAKMRKDALEEFLKRISYEENSFMNLLTATGYLKTLTAVSKEIDKAMVEKYVPAFKEADVFLLTSLLIREDIDGLMEQVNLASPKDAIGSLCFILRQFRIAWKRCFFKDVSADGTQALEKYDAETLKRCIGIINGTIGAIKSGMMPDDIALKVACSELAVCMS